MRDVIIAIVSAMVGAVCGWLAVRRKPAPPSPLAPQAGADDAVAALAIARAQASKLRHDLRGILSPAMLTADRLLASADPSVRRAGEIVLRTVERATDRLVDDTADQPDVNASR